jgi:nitrate reductase cytochrome c-type subunit
LLRLNRFFDVISLDKVFIIRGHMPINYNKYPPNWKTEIRPRILSRANNKCEFCGVKNYSIREGKRIILTVMHLDHDAENWDVKDSRLRAACQKCHLNFDRIERHERNKHDRTKIS